MAFFKLIASLVVSSSILVSLGAPSALAAENHSHSHSHSIGGENFSHSFSHGNAQAHAIVKNGSSIKSSSFAHSRKSKGTPQSSALKREKGESIRNNHARTGKPGETGKPGKPGKPGKIINIGKNNPKSKESSTGGKNKKQRGKRIHRARTFENCTQVRNSGKAPLIKGQDVEYREKLDRDKDGIACE